MKRIIELQKIMLLIKRARLNNFLTQMALKVMKISNKLVAHALSNEMRGYRVLYDATKDFRWIKYKVELENMMMKMKGLSDESLGDD